MKSIEKLKFHILVTYFLARSSDFLEFGGHHVVAYTRFQTVHSAKLTGSWQHHNIFITDIKVYQFSHLARKDISRHTKMLELGYLSFIHF